jgi:S1-C subfamily serine protease
MKKLLVALVACSLLLSSCLPDQVSLARRCELSTVLLHIKLAKGDRRGWGACSGVYVSPHIILTADHCVDMELDGAKDIKIKEIWVRNVLGHGARATVLKQDRRRDLALIRTPLTGLPVALAHHVRLGEDVWIVGNPLGLTFVVSKGIVSRTSLKTEDFPCNHFVVDAVVLPGNSGGPSFNSRGELIGIVTMSTSLFGTFGASGLGIVVQIDEVRHFLKHVK